MSRILHAADLHLSGTDKDYGLAVFEELIETARREHADFVLFCGDLFDTFPDAEKLRGEFRRILGSPPFEFMYLPGNHESLRLGAGDLARLDLGAVTLLDVAPFRLERRECGGAPLEFLAIPHQDDYSGYGIWPVPPKGNAWRIALAHGVVAGMAYRGPDQEGGASAIDPDMFRRFGVDYAALGHIHGRRCQVHGSAMLAYPGSARVWRRNESGARGVFLIDLPGIRPPGAQGGCVLPEPAFLPLESAGEYRRYSLPLSLEGALPDIESLARDWGRADHVELKLGGVVEDERAAAELEAALRVRFGSRVRRLDIDREDVSALPGISSHPIARRFLEAWADRMPRAGAAPDQDRAETGIWLRARELALNALKADLERAS